MAAFYQLKIKYDQDKFDADYLDAWPLFIRLKKKCDQNKFEVDFLDAWRLFIN